MSLALLWCIRSRNLQAALISAGCLIDFLCCDFTCSRCWFMKGSSSSRQAPQLQQQQQQQQLSLYVCVCVCSCRGQKAQGEHLHLDWIRLPFGHCSPLFILLFFPLLCLFPRYEGCKRKKSKFASISMGDKKVAGKKQQKNKKWKIVCFCVESRELWQILIKCIIRIYYSNTFDLCKACSHSVIVYKY